MELMVDGYVDRWLTRLELELAVSNLIGLIGMRAVGEFAYRDTPVGPSCWQMLLESHVAVDYIKSYVCITVFSCKSFDAGEAAKFCIQRFLINKVAREMLIQRGFGE